MRALPLAALVALLLAPTAAAWTPPSLGDHREYRSSSSTGEGSAREVVAAFEEAGSEGVSYEAVRIDTRTEWQDEPAEHFVSEGSRWLRLSDGAEIRSVTRTIDPPPGVPSLVEITYTPPCLAWPPVLEVGARLEGLCEGPRVTHLNGEVYEGREVRPFDLEVTGEEPVEVTAGTFQSFVVQDRAKHRTSVTAYAPDACGPVFVVARDTTVELVAFRCAALERAPEPTAAPTPAAPTATPPPEATPASAPPAGDPPRDDDVSGRGVALALLALVLALLGTRARRR